MRHLVLGIMLFAVPAIALAQQNGIQIENAWSRAAMAGRTGVVYLTITDTGAPDSLTAASSPVASKADLHESFTDNGVAKMRDVTALPVQPGKPLTLAPDGYHIMLTGLKQPLKQGDTFPLTLSFAKAGPVTTTVTVQKPGGGMSMPGMPMHGGDTTK
jgi:hypothetical protein